MRRAAGDDLQLAGLEEAAEAVDEVVVVLLDEHVPRPRQAVVVHVGELIELVLPARAFDLLAGQGNQIIEMANVAILQERVGKHGGKGRRERHGQPPIDAVAFEAVENVEEGNVSLGDGFVEPVLF